MGATYLPAPVSHDQCINPLQLTSRTRHLDPSINLHHTPIHVPASLPKQKRNYIRNLFRRSQPLQRIARPHPFHGLPTLDDPRVCGRVNVAWTHAVHTNASWTELERERLRHPNQPELGRTVYRLQCAAADTAYARDINDCRAAG